MTARGSATESVLKETDAESRGITGEPEQDQQLQKAGKTNAEPIKHQSPAAAQRENVYGAKPQKCAFDQKEERKKPHTEG
ncbi:hypothetical protein SUBVAR_04974 [Subdoligranulum variabile DSM 15176]|uniref:Uncharacterized protein n=1 Tax=Subdoligranulum variabile DSM 15176 TaxID=411471 RepID=D1PKU0_9FIRM|nr:hypothetical protein SUBVAR_04974 [Subdoligranulum variabile DSM 15176]